MKRLLVISLIVSLFGCGKDDETKFYTFSGQVLQYPNLTPAANVDLALSTTAYRDRFPSSYELAKGKTDSNGKYEFQISTEEFSTSLFLYEGHPSYTVRINKSGYVQLPSFTIRGLFTGNPINPGEPIVGEPTNLIGNPPEDYFEREIKLGRETFLSFSAESLNEEIDSVYLMVYHIVSNGSDTNSEEDRFFRSFIFHENYESQGVIGGFPAPYYLGRMRNDFPMDTTLVVPMSFDPHNKIAISWTLYTGTDSVKYNREINLLVGETIEVFE